MSPRFAGTNAAVQDSIRSARAIAQQSNCQSFESASSTEQMDALWSARRQSLWASLAARPPGTQIWSTDVAVPVSRMAELIGEYPGTDDTQHERRTGLMALLRGAEICRDRASRLGLFNSIVGHVGDGNFHQVIMYNPDVPEQKTAVKECVNAMVDDAISMDGTVSVSRRDVEWRS